MATQLAWTCRLHSNLYSEIFMKELPQSSGFWGDEEQVQPMQSVSLLSQSNWWVQEAIISNHFLWLDHLFVKKLFFKINHCFLLLISHKLLLTRSCTASCMCPPDYVVLISSCWFHITAGQCPLNGSTVASAQQIPPSLLFTPSPGVKTGSSSCMCVRITIWKMEIESARVCPALKKQGSALHCVLPVAKTRGLFFLHGLCVAQDSRNVTLTADWGWTMDCPWAFANGTGRYMGMGRCFLCFQCQYLLFLWSRSTNCQILSSAPLESHNF